MFESNTNVNVLSDNIDIIDSIYRLWLQAIIFIVLWLLHLERLLTTLLKTDDFFFLFTQFLGKELFLESVYVYTNYNKRFYVSKNDNMKKRRKMHCLQKFNGIPSPTLTLHALDGSDDLICSYNL